MAVESQVVVPFSQQILCSSCENFMCGPLGMYCGYWHEEIVDEKNAQDCEEFTHN